MIGRSKYWVILRPNLGTNIGEIRFVIYGLISRASVFSGRRNKKSQKHFPNAQLEKNTAIDIIEMHQCCSSQLSRFDCKMAYFDLSSSTGIVGCCGGGACICVIVSILLWFICSLFIVRF